MRKRTQRLELRLTDGERGRLHAAARVVGMTITDYVLSRCLDDLPVTKAPTSDTKPQSALAKMLADR